MPLFEYKCKKCNTVFEKLVIHSDDKVVCENCGSEKAEKQLSTFAAKVNEGEGNSCSVSDCTSCCPSGTCGPGH